MTAVAASRQRRSDVVPDDLVEIVCKRLAENKRVRRTLPGPGRISVDRQLPFLCVYRRPPRGGDDGTERFATSEASYLVGSGRQADHRSVTTLVRGVAETMSREFGAFLVIEIWATRRTGGDEPVVVGGLTPEITVFSTRHASDPVMASTFESSFSRIRLDGRKARVALRTVTRCSPRGMKPVLSADDARRIGCQHFGVEIDPIFRDPVNGEVFPRILRLLVRGFTVSLRRALFEFARAHTTHRPAHFHTLGRRAVVKAVWDVDRILADVSEKFDFLLQVTPVNGEQAWSEFQRSGCKRQPALHYRPLATEPLVLKRNLYRAPVERIEDPALAMIFRQKLEEIERQITMLQEINTERFLHESLQQFGGVEDELQDVATGLLRAIPPRARDAGRGAAVDAAAFAARAQREVAYFRQRMPEIAAKIEIRPDITGLMVSRGNLMISARMKIPESRVEALIQHEVGTHVLTYHNGRVQRLRHMATGFAGYDALQEGLAVLSEYLVGGLSRPRLRLLAGRVVAARLLVEGATFVETFRVLEGEHGFARRTAFIVTMRTFRGGGLTKDAVYLRGLLQILGYLKKGGGLEPLFLGKIAAEHIPVVRELQWRGVLRDAPLTPRYMSDAAALARLARLRDGVTLADLAKG